MQELALDCLQRARASTTWRSTWATRASCAACWPACALDAEQLTRICAALAAKDAAALRDADAAVCRRDVAQARCMRCCRFTAASRCSTRRARRCRARTAASGRARRPGVAGRACGERIRTCRSASTSPTSSGYAYYSGARFAVYAARWPATRSLRGGRYDEVGAVFGRNRPAVGFSLDLKAVASLAATRRRRAAIRAPWGEDAALRAGGAPAARARRDAWSASCPGTSTRARSSTATASWSRLGGQWVVRAL